MPLLRCAAGGGAAPHRSTKSELAGQEGIGSRTACFIASLRSLFRPTAIHKSALSPNGTSS
jgi:hypothetical protein